MVQYKQQSRLEEKRKKALDLQLDFIVGQTEKYSDLLSKSLAPIKPPEIVPVTPKRSLSAGADEDGELFLSFFFANESLFSKSLTALCLTSVHHKAILPLFENEPHSRISAKILSGPVSSHTSV